MNISDLIFLLRQDLSRTFRFMNPGGKRTELEPLWKRSSRLVIAIAIAVIITLFIVFPGRPLWPLARSVATENPGLGATIFNTLMLFSFLGSTAVMASTVANSSRMEYLMVMPISLRTLFLEKVIITVFYNSIFWLVIGGSIFAGFSILSPALFAFISIPVFLLSMYLLIAIGVSFGGLLGLGVSRLVAGRRRLKQVGYAILTAAGIIGGTLWYASFYLSDGGFGFGLFTGVFDILQSLGFSSDLTPGYAASSITLRTLVGLPIPIQDLAMAIFYGFLSVGLLYLTAIASEKAHYSGWLASAEKRTPKKAAPVDHSTWDPQPIPGIKFNQTISASVWYNISTIRREARVLTQYLLGPIRYVIWIILPAFAGGEMIFAFTPYLMISAVIPIALAYGYYFAGLETVYEGDNIMNLQLASVNLQDYLKGKVYSALPFTIGAGVITSVFIYFLTPILLLYLPAITIGLLFLTMASGASAAYAAADGGEFKAERQIERQRGSSTQMPISIWSLVRALIFPLLLGYIGIFGMISIGLTMNVLYTYLALPGFALICYLLFRRNTRLAGLKLAKMDASEYL